MEGYYFDHALLISCIDGLGRFNERLEVYEKDLDTVNCLKDIDRFLRRDFEDTKEALLTMGKCNVVSQNLLPLLKTYPSDQDILYHTMRVLVLMSMPPQDSYPHNIKDIHHSIKAEFTNADAIAILMSMCHEPLSHFDDLSDAHYKILQMFITFIRNMMLIPDADDCGNAAARHHFSTLQVDFLKTSFSENVLELVGLIGQHMGTKVLKADAPVMLDLLHGIYASFDPRSVLNADESVLLNRNKARAATAEDLDRPPPETSQFAIKSEKPVHSTINHISTSKQQSRHAAKNPGVRLMGQSGESAFYVKTVPGTFGQVVLKNAARTKAATKVQATANTSAGSVPKTTNVVLLASVKVYTSQLLRGAFNAVMSVIRDEASLGLNICSMSGKSVLRFFELAAWFMQYCRYQEEVRAKQASKIKADKRPSFSSSLYQSTSSILSWKMIQTVLRVWLEMLDTDGKQKKGTDWGLQEASIKVLKEALSLLDLAYHYGSEDDKRAADMLQRRLLQDDTKEAGVLNRITRCMRQFKKHDKRIARQEGRESRAYAIDMVKTMHVVLRVYSRLCQESFSVVRTSHRKSNAGAKNCPLAAAAAEDTKSPPASNSAPEAKDSEDAEDAEPDGDRNEDDGETEPSNSDDENGKVSRVLQGKMGSVDDSAENQRIDLDDLADDAGPQRKVDFAAVLKSTSHVEILKLYLFLLEKYRALDAATLHAIATFLGRLCNELRVEPMLYQISYLKQFHMILSDDSIKSKSMYNSLKKVMSRIASHVIARLDPTPISIPGPDPSGGQDGPAAAADQEQDDSFPAAVQDTVLACLPAHSRQDTLLKVQDRVTKLLFVELLFEKGARESEMIQAEYNWRKALLDRAEGRNDQHHQPDDVDDDDQLPDAPRHAPGQLDDVAADDSEDEDALPQPGAQKQAPHRPAKGLAAGLQMTPDEQLRFKALFETVNGSRSARQLLLSEWNQQEELQLTAKQVAKTMTALSLRPGELTPEQEERLAVCVEEYGRHGRRAYKRIANAFPGGFSSAAIKKHMGRLKLTLSGSGKSKRTLEDLDDPTDNATGSGAARSTVNRKRGRKPHASPPDLEDDGASSDDSNDDNAPEQPATKKRRSSHGNLTDSEDNSALDEAGAGGAHGLEDDVALPLGSAAARTLDSSDDEWRREDEPERGQLPGRIESNGLDEPKSPELSMPEIKHNAMTGERKNRPEASQGSGVGAKKANKAANAKSVKEKRRHAAADGVSASKRSKSEKQMTPGTQRYNIAASMRAIEDAARQVKNALREQGVGDVSVEDVAMIIADLLARIEAEQATQDPNQVHLRICPDSDAEEQIMGLPATEALLESLGLRSGDSDDPSIWVLSGSVQELQERLTSLLEAAPSMAGQGEGEQAGIHKDQGQNHAMLEDGAEAPPRLAGPLDDEDDDFDALERNQSVRAPASAKRQKLALLSDDDDASEEAQASQPHSSEGQIPAEGANAGMQHVAEHDIADVGDGMPAPAACSHPADNAAADHTAPDSVASGDVAADDVAADGVAADDVPADGVAGTMSETEIDAHTDLACTAAPTACATGSGTAQEEPHLEGAGALVGQNVMQYGAADTPGSNDDSMQDNAADAPDESGDAIHDYAANAPGSDGVAVVDDTLQQRTEHPAGMCADDGCVEGKDDLLACTSIDQAADAEDTPEQQDLSYAMDNELVEHAGGFSLDRDGLTGNVSVSVTEQKEKQALSVFASEPAAPAKPSAATQPATPAAVVAVAVAEALAEASSAGGQRRQTIEDSHMQAADAADAVLGSSFERVPDLGDAARQGSAVATRATLEQPSAAAAEDMSPHLAPMAVLERASGDADMRTPVMATMLSGIVRTRSATRSVTFSEVTTDLASGPMHEWQGGHQRQRHDRGDGGDAGQDGTPQLPRPALKPQCHAHAVGPGDSGDSPPLPFTAQGSIADIPPSFSICPDAETASADGGRQRLPLSPIKVTPARENIVPLLSSQLTAALTAPASQGRRPHTKKARLEAMRASQETAPSPAVPSAANVSGEKAVKWDASTPAALAASASSITQ